MYTTELFTPGARYHKAAGKERNPLTGDIRFTPQHTLVVTQTNDEGVAFDLDGKPGALAYGDFVRLARKTIANGATFFPA